ncbi:MAG TPA: alpha-L-fucosidase [Capsulimonadaceae bacterium]|jgi:alpha-L-fucosidase
MMQQWFSSAKFGIFMHWGIYAVNGISESWSFYRGEISLDDYMAQCAGFDASNYDPNAWAELFEAAGARYAVLTTKHHDGIALWDTQQNDASVVKRTPAARDLIAPYADAMRAHGIKVGLYYSHCDWVHPDFSPIPVKERGFANHNQTPYLDWPLGPKTEAWQRFLKFHRGQLTELATNYGEIDLFWFDGDWIPDNSYWNMIEVRDLLFKHQPTAINNSRLQGYGDYETPEQAIPVVAPAKPWEFCVTMNDHWGYVPSDTNYKSVRELIQILCECIGMGGNLLLDIGPRPDGTIPEEASVRLLAMGDWIKRHEAAIYPTKAGLPPGHLYGTSTMSQDETELFLFIFDKPFGEISLKGVRNQIKRASIVGTGEELTTRISGGAPWANIPGVMWLDMATATIDPLCTVIRLELDGKLDLYRGAGRAIEQN